MQVQLLANNLVPDGKVQKNERMPTAPISCLNNAIDTPEIAMSIN